MLFPVEKIYSFLDSKVVIQGKLLIQKMTGVICCYIITLSVAAVPRTRNFKADFRPYCGTRLIDKDAIDDCREVIDSITPPPNDCVVYQCSFHYNAPFAQKTDSYPCHRKPD